jgi:2-keto-3-deoxy-L-fuconate dehydrogenase
MTREHPPSSGVFVGQRAVVTQALDFMGPSIVEAFRREGAEVMADSRDLTSQEAALELVNEAGRIDILIVNLMLRNPRTCLTETTDDLWSAQFEAMVHPLHRLVRAVLPQMMACRAGKIVVIGSANGLRGSAPRAAYSAARGAQLAYVRSAGFEAAPYNIQINAIAQNWVSNPSSYPKNVTSDPAFAIRLAEVPTGRVAEGWESAALALFLAGPDSDFFVGQIFPFAGGWLT